jgi:hypothetical protein
MRNHFQAALVSALDSKNPKTPPLARHGRSIVPNRSEPERTVACASNSRKIKDAAACAPRRAIGDNGSTKEDPW